MRTSIVLFICLLLAASSCSAQRSIDNAYLHGVWQVSSHKIGAAYLENYQFFDDGSFIFNTNQYNELRRIISLSGHYTINEDLLHLKVISFIEDTGSLQITRSRTTKVNDSWSLAGNYTETKRKVKDPEISIVEMKLCQDINEIACILIDGNTYYKIIADPNDY